MENWESADISEIKPGDLIQGTTMTNSQKYLMREGYEDCNAVKIGFVTSKKHDEIYDIIIHNFAKNEQDKVVEWVGTSGFSYVEKMNQKYWSDEVKEKYKKIFG